MYTIFRLEFSLLTTKACFRLFFTPASYICASSTENDGTLHTVAGSCSFNRDESGRQLAIFFPDIFHAYIREKSRRLRKYEANSNCYVANDKNALIISRHVTVNVLSSILIHWYWSDYLKIR